MKKIILALALTLVLASCGGGGDGGSPVAGPGDEPAIGSITEGTGTAMAAKDLPVIENLVREVVYQVAYQWMDSAANNMLSQDAKDEGRATACTTGGYTYFIGTPMVEDSGVGVITVDGTYQISKTERAFSEETKLGGNFAEYQNPKIYLVDKSITIGGDVDFLDGSSATGSITSACADFANGTKYLTGMTMTKALSGGFSISGDIAGALTFGVSMTETYTSPTQTVPAIFTYDGSATFKSGDVTATCAITAEAHPNSYDEISIICQ